MRKEEKIKGIAKRIEKEKRNKEKENKNTKL